jgi:hypothetical protein
VTPYRGDYVAEDNGYQHWRDERTVAEQAGQTEHGRHGDSDELDLGGDRP